MHSNAWDNYHIYLKTCILFIFSFADFLPYCLPFSILYFVVKIVKSVVSFMMSLSLCNIVYICFWADRNLCC